MQRYIARRLIIMVPTFLIVSLVVAGMVRVLPQDIVDVMAEEYRYAESAEALRRMLGLDQPFYVQYLGWMRSVFAGDLGVSMWTHQPITTELAVRMPVTVELGLLAMAINLLIAIPIGTIAAVRQDSWVDYMLRSTAVAALSIPNFWLGTLVVTLPAIWIGWAPPLQFTPLTKDPLANLGGLIIPALILGFFFQGRTMRMVRTTMLDVLRQDYVRTAWAKGLPQRLVVLRHAAKNTLIPVVTLVALEVPFLLGGTVILEKIFSLPGMGLYLLDALTVRDYVAVQSVVLVFAGFIMALNLLVDVSYCWLDPRVRYH